MRQCICLIETGGTIGMTLDLASKALRPAYSMNELLPTIPELEASVEVDVVTVCNIDSTNMTPNEWRDIAEAIQYRYNNPRYKGFVVTHGTDTMTYTACALSFMLRNLSKPIVLTGAQLPLGEPRPFDQKTIAPDGGGFVNPIVNDVATDARCNLVNAIMAACQDMAEVCIMFGHYLLRGNRSRKLSEFDLNAFTSFDVPPLGVIGLRWKLMPHRVCRAVRELQWMPDLDDRVFLLKMHPLLDENVFKSLVDHDYRGLVIEAYGAGNIPRRLLQAVTRLVETGMLVVICTQCSIGAAELGLYHDTSQVFLEAGAVSALDMTPEAALVKLMWVLAQTNDRDEAIRRYQSPVAGELSNDSRWPIARAKIGAHRTAKLT